MVDFFEVLTAHMELGLVADPDNPWAYTGEYRCTCGEIVRCQGVPLDAKPSITRWLLRKHQAEVLEDLIMSKAEVLRREFEWLESAWENSASLGYSAQFRAGFRGAAGWVRFHSENPENYHHLYTSKEREQEDAGQEG